MPGSGLDNVSASLLFSKQHCVMKALLTLFLINSEPKV
jgi:hypothetical protein